MSHKTNVWILKLAANAEHLFNNYNIDLFIEYVEFVALGLPQTSPADLSPKCLQPLPLATLIGKKHFVLHDTNAMASQRILHLLRRLVPTATTSRPALMFGEIDNHLSVHRLRTATSLLLYARSPCPECHDFSSPSPLPPAPAHRVYHTESAEEFKYLSPLSGTNTTPDLLLVNKRTPLSERNTTPDQGGGGDEDAAKRKLSNPILARVVVGCKLSKPRQKPVSERPVLRMRGDREARYRGQSTGHYQTDSLASRREKFNDISPQAVFEEDLYAAMALSGTKAQVLEMHKECQNTPSRLEAKEESPPFNKPREATPDLTSFTNIQKRERRMTQWDIKSAGYENITAGWHRNSLQSHWSAYSVQWLTLEAPPPR
ncbi:hypothetical protein J4E83_010232 [Alternaria metachromatica]|uniref:uncharacterized protein n=1 Tax=Alternaria metachromatica TaxID=283354 RepID=UPI0020C54A95|nr:uncharacterized protein J4E83_010232 [Alternaria metachromatica]KAI4606211.1 hypothetical protein J4E83_010232 [Alternaria metachromatica]